MPASPHTHSNTTDTDPMADTLRSPVPPDSVSANDNQCAAPPFPLERDLEAVIVAAASGDELAKEVLRPAVHRLVLDSLIYLDEAARVTDHVLLALGAETGRPFPGCAVAFLQAVIRAHADRDFEETRRKQYEQHDPPPRNRKRAPLASPRGRRR